VETRRWYNSNLPQTLVVSQMLLYLNGVTLLLFGLLVGGIGLFSLAFIVGEVAAAYGIANSSKGGYRLGIVFASLVLAFYLVAIPLLVHGFFSFSYVINLMFAVALEAALLHTQSREYTKIWFS
jgi:hypothetical protein